MAGVLLTAGLLSVIGLTARQSINAVASGTVGPFSQHALIKILGIDPSN
jgi:hypothetical protein